MLVSLTLVVMGIASLLTSASLFGYNKWFLFCYFNLCLFFSPLISFFEALSGRLLLPLPCCKYGTKLAAASVWLSSHFLKESIALSLTYSSHLVFRTPCLDGVLSLSPVTLSSLLY